jgi:5-hydroxyisourate hydrolase
VSGRLTTHVLDLALGRPAAGVTVTLAHQARPGEWTTVAERATDDDGRVQDFLGEVALSPGRYLLTFGTGAYFRSRGVNAFHPEIPVLVEIGDPSQHYHVPLLLSPFGYSTYRGS